MYLLIADWAASSKLKYEDSLFNAMQYKFRSSQDSGDLQIRQKKCIPKNETHQ